MNEPPNTPTWEERAALQQRPARSPAMFHSWEKLLFLHWLVDPEAIQQTLPPGLWVDLHEEYAYIAIVPFYMRRIRPRFLPAIPHFSYFLECNVRTYVHDANGRPGVWFYSLDTSRWLAYWLARRFFHLPYFWAQMHADTDPAFPFHYELRRRSEKDQASYRYQVSGGAKQAAPETLDFFLLERYILYSWNARAKRLHCGRVHHQPYRVAPVELARWSALPLAWDGLKPIDGPPVHQCYAERVDVEVFGIENA